ncbi:ATP-dependent helicase HrpB [Haematococcus lacustris]
MAALLGEQVGERCGYRVRLETRVSAATRIEVVTEGVLMRMLQSDPQLSEVGAILFDEFHERNLDADLALALALDLQASTRPDLRLLVMSATLGGGLATRTAALMGQAGAGLGQGANVPIVTSEGRSFPVTLKHLAPPNDEREGLETAVAQAVAQVLKQDRGGGDILCFLPGVQEIRTTERLLGMRYATVMRNIEVVQLHGTLSTAVQDRVLAPRGPGASRRVILATPIAESSLTIEGVRVVIDSGLRRTPIYDADAGISRLKTVRVSQASADQRSGRAGRLGPGVAYRLWSQGMALKASTPPEILEADLAPLILELAVWGVELETPTAAAHAVPWLDPPPAARVATATELLRELGALNDQGQITPQGKAMAGLGVHPRYAHMVLEGRRLDGVQLAAVLAAMLSERDFLRVGRQEAVRTASIALRVAALAKSVKAETRDIAGVAALTTVLGPIEALTRDADREAMRMILLGARGIAASAAAVLNSSDWQAGPSLVSGDESDRGMSSAEDDSDTDDGSDDDRQRKPFTVVQGRREVTRETAEEFNAAWLKQAGRTDLIGALVALAYPDRLATLVENEGERVTFCVSGGGTVRLPSNEDPLGETTQILAIAEMVGAREGSGQHDMIALAAPLSLKTIKDQLSHLVQTYTTVAWATASHAVVAKKRTRIGSLVLSDMHVPVSDDAAWPALLQGIRQMGGISALGDDREWDRWRQRMQWLRRLDCARSPGGSSNLPDLSDEALMDSIESWLRPLVKGVRTKTQLMRLDLSGAIKNQVQYMDQERVEWEAPSHLELPTGGRLPISYEDTPTVACRVQEVFGLTVNPTVSHAKVPLTFVLRAPNGKTLQKTSDIAGFWTNSYKGAIADAKRRYPKHFWPDDPRTAEPTSKTKKAKQLEERMQGKGGEDISKQDKNDKNQKKQKKKK